MIKNKWIFKTLFWWHWLISGRKLASYRMYRIMIMGQYREVIWDEIWKGGWTYHFIVHQWSPVFMWYPQSENFVYMETMDLLLDGKWA